LTRENPLALDRERRRLAAHFQAMFETTRSLPLTDCKACLQQAIVVLEWFHLNSYARLQVLETEFDRAPAALAASVRAELTDAQVDAAEPQGRSGVGLIREFVLVRRLPTVVYCRTRRPATVALELLCADAPMGLKQALKGHVSEADFKRLTKAAGRVAAAPLSFCDARHGPLQARSIADLAARGYLGVAVVDGSLAPREVAALERVTAEWPVMVVAPHAAAAA
jgi:hypothetical protein